MLTHGPRTCLAAGVTAVLVVVGFAPSSTAAEAVRVSGSGAPAADDECVTDQGYGEANAPAGVPPLSFDEGDLIGCYYVDTADTRVTATGGGRYRLVEQGTETFIGTFDGDPVTFRTSYVFLAWFLGDPSDGGTQLSGGCHHPLIEGGTGALHFTDDVENGLIRYRGVINLS